MGLGTLLLFQVLNGLVRGLVIALIAPGLALIFGVLGVINVAHGSLYMLGAVVAWYLLERTGSFWLALAAAPLLVGLLSMGIERVVLRPVETEKVLTIIATTGVLMIIQHSVIATFGGGVPRIPNPVPGAIDVFGLRYPVYRLVVAGLSVVAIALLWVFLTPSATGRSSRSAPTARLSRRSTPCGAPGWPSSWRRCRASRPRRWSASSRCAS
jgi:branched-chain amino acid transport system permease protein